MSSLQAFVPFPARPVATSNGLSKVSAEEFLARAIDFIPTGFGRLTLLASLGDKESGGYRQAFAALALDDAAIDEALSRLHDRIFRQWMEPGLSEQTEDIIRYCRTAGKSAREVAARWIRGIDDAAKLVPPTLPEPERISCSRKLALALAGAYGQLA